MPELKNKKRRKLKIVLAGGGTGGHFYPLLAVAVEFQILAAQQNIDLDLFYLGTASTKYYNLFLKNNIVVKKTLAGKFRRTLSLSNLFDLIKFAIGFLQSLWHLFWIMPDTVFSKGGPGALSVVFAAVVYRIPVFIHESDSVSGLTNVISAKFSKAIFIAFKENAKSFNQNRNVVVSRMLNISSSMPLTIVVGNPIRRYILNDIPKKERAKKILGLNPEIPLLLFLGGSQGAVRINNIVIKNLKSLLSNYQIFHQIGDANYNDFENQINSVLKEIPFKIRSRYFFVDYFYDDFKDILAAADLVISRAGSGAIFEIAAFGKPSILIPLPESASDHQLLNSQIYSSSGAALVMEEKDYFPEHFLNLIESLLLNPEILEKMSARAKEFSKPEAAKIIAQKIIELT